MPPLIPLDYSNHLDFKREDRHDECPAIQPHGGDPMTGPSRSGYRTACILTFLLSVGGMHIANAQQTKAPDEPGTVTYHGVLGGIEFQSLKIGPPHGGMSRVTVDVHVQGCFGTTSGMASVQGDTLLLTKDDDGNECRLTIHRTASGATVNEKNCMVAHGTSCDFDSQGKLLRRDR